VYISKALETILRISKNYVQYVFKDDFGHIATKIYKKQTDFDCQIDRILLGSGIFFSGSDLA
jgi:hypothetical protein